MPVKNPRQPIVITDDGVVRFKYNSIVSELLKRCSANGFTLNEIARGGFDPDDYDQLMQLIGYSVDGYGELSGSPRRSVLAADKTAARLRREGTSKVAK